MVYVCKIIPFVTHMISYAYCTHHGKNTRFDKIHIGSIDCFILVQYQSSSSITWWPGMIRSETKWASGKTFSSTFTWMKIILLSFKFHRSLFLGPNWQMSSLAKIMICRLLGTKSLAIVWINDVSIQWCIYMLWLPGPNMLTHRSLMPKNDIQLRKHFNQSETV